MRQVVGQAPAGSWPDVDEAVAAILALCSGLAIERHTDPGATSDGLLGRVLDQPSPS